MSAFTELKETLARIVEPHLADDLSVNREDAKQLTISNLVRRTAAMLLAWDGSRLRRLQSDKEGALYVDAASQGSTRKAIPLDDEGRVENCPRVAIYNEATFTTIVADSEGRLLIVPDAPSKIASDGNTYALQGDTSGRVFVVPQQATAQTCAFATLTITDADSQSLPAAQGTYCTRLVKNVGSENVLISTNSSPAAANGFRLRPGDEIVVRSSNTLYAKCETASSSSDVAVATQYT